MKPGPLLGQDRAPSGQPLTWFPTGKTPQTSPHEHQWLPGLPHLRRVKESLEYGKGDSQWEEDSLWQAAAIPVKQQIW